MKQFQTQQQTNCRYIMKKSESITNVASEELATGSGAGAISKLLSQTNTAHSSGNEEIKIQQLFKLMVDSKASDLHITSGTPPGLRVHGEVIRVKTGSLTADDTKRLIYQILSEEQKNEFEKKFPYREKHITSTQLNN